MADDTMYTYELRFAEIAIYAFLMGLASASLRCVGAAMLLGQTEDRYSKAD